MSRDAPRLRGRISRPMTTRATSTPRSWLRSARPSRRTTARASRAHGRPARGGSRRPARSARPGAPPAPDRALGPRFRLRGADRSRRDGPRGNPRGTQDRDRGRGRARPRSDDAVYILEDLDEAEQAEILDQLPAIERVALQRSLDYPEESAGRRMQTEFIAVPPFWTVGQTIDYMRETDGPARTTFYEIFVVDPGYRLARHRAARPAAALEAPDARSTTIMSREPDVGAGDGRPGGRGAPVRALQPRLGRRRRRGRPARRRDHGRRHRRRDRGGGGRGHQGARRRRPRGGTVGQGLGHRARAASAGCSSICVTAFLGLLGARPVRGSAARRWWRSPCWRRSSRARAAMPAPRP